MLFQVDATNTNNKLLNFPLVLNNAASGKLEIRGSTTKIPPPPHPPPPYTLHPPPSPYTLHPPPSPYTLHPPPSPYTLHLPPSNTLL